PPGARPAAAPGAGSDAPLASGPVAIAQRLLVELARRPARKLVGEVDRARALDAGEMPAAELDQLRLEFRPRGHAGHRLRHRLDLLAEIVARHAEDRGIG